MAIPPAPGPRARERFFSSEVVADCRGEQVLLRF